MLWYVCTKGNGFPYLWKGYFQPTFSEKFSEDEDYKDGHTKVLSHGWKGSTIAG